MVGGGISASDGDPIGQFCLFLKREGRSPVTVMNYRCDLEGLVRWSEDIVHKKFNLRHFAANDLQNYREFLIRKYKAATVNRKLAAWKVYSNWAVQAGLLNSHELPSMRKVKLAPKLKSSPRWMDPSNQIRLLRSVISGGIVKDIAVITLLLNTGIRVSELCTLTWNDVRISGEKGMLTICSKQASRVDVPLNEAARKALISLGYLRKAGKAETIFTGRSGAMTRRGVVMLLNRYCKIAGLEMVTPATLRNSFCMNLASAGVSPHILERFLFHRSPQSTALYYSPLQRDLEQAEELKAVEALAESLAFDPRLR